MTALGTRTWEESKSRPCSHDCEWMGWTGNFGQTTTGVGIGSTWRALRQAETVAQAFPDVLE